MTTLAIIGGGIAGRSLLYALAKEKKRYSQVFLFESESFASPCSLNSTAVVAPRGVSLGHSPLGDIIAQAFLEFQKHVLEDSPNGVSAISQFTGSTTKLDEFKKRYPLGSLTTEIGKLKLNEEIYFAHEKAFLIRPKVYLDWLMKEAMAVLPIKHEMDFVKEVNKEGSDFILGTQKGSTFRFDEVVLATGYNNKIWSPLFPALKEVNAKSVQGAYFEISHDLGNESFSITLDGENLVYHGDQKLLLVGSTTQDSLLLLPPKKELEFILTHLSQRFSLNLSAGKIKVGLREKAKKREPYLIQDGSLMAMGGFYKNGFSLGASFGKKAAVLLVSK